VSSPEPALGISAVERETGLSKDVLRKWEARYGFPAPRRGDNGERIYPLEQVSRLRQIKRLLDSGLRPGRIVGAGQEVLEDLGRDRLGGAEASGEDTDPPKFIDSLRRQDGPTVRRALYRLMLRDGLQRFAQVTAPRLITAVGEAWSQGDLGVHDEHLFTELMQGMLRAVVSDLTEERGRPRVLLTTFPGEPHGLGLSLLAALLALEGAHCTSLGPEVPVLDIQKASQRRQIDVVALSFSNLLPGRRAGSGLNDLGGGLPRGTEIWVGGNGAAHLKHRTDCVRVFRDLSEIGHAVAAWRRDATDTAARA